jgi:aminoglycoside/choline kinase family phosphotransferase
MNLVTDSRRDAVSAFLAESGWGAAELNPLPGDASTRRYIRLHLNGRTAMLMDQPQHAEAPTAAADATSETRRALGYNALARLAGADCGRFVAAARHLKRRGLGAPEVLAADVAQGFLILEDLGEDLYTDVIAAGGDERQLYEAAIEVLARMHAEPAPFSLAADKPLFPYDETALLAEIDLLTEWFVPLALNRPLEADLAREHRALWQEALRHLDGGRVFVHRDFHAQNLLWRRGHEGLARVGIVDFQDAVAGAPAYDVVSLLEDARRDVAPEFAQAMMDLYLVASAREGMARDPSHFALTAAVLAAQRNAKIIGIFARLFKRDKKPRYLAHLPRVWRYMERDLQHPVLARLKSWYERHVPQHARSIRAEQS